jgi:hypothetical protein
VAADNYPRPEEDGAKLRDPTSVGKAMTLDEFKSKCCA